MNFKIGDKVSFLNEAGGGIVAGIASKGIVNVAIEDGFEIPVMVTNLVLIEAAKEELLAKPFSKATDKKVNKVIEEDEEFTEAIPGFVTEKTGVYLAFDKINEEDINIYLINNTLNVLVFSYFFKHAGEYVGVETNKLSAKQQILLETTEMAAINQWKDVTFQFIYFKEGQTKLFQPVTKSAQVNPTKLFKQGSFKKTSFFKNEVILVYIDDAIDAVLEISPEKKETTPNYQEIIAQKEDSPYTITVSKVHRKNNPELQKVVDLHIHNLVENSGQLLPQEIIEIQLSHFKKEFEDAVAKNLTKITFIHGVGTGRLKQEIVDFLKRQTGIVFFDAPLKEYGVGATDVRII